MRRHPWSFPCKFVPYTIRFKEYPLTTGHKVTAKIRTAQMLFPLFPQFFSTPFLLINPRSGRRPPGALSAPCPPVSSDGFPDAERENFPCRRECHKNNRRVTSRRCHPPERLVRPLYFNSGSGPLKSQTSEDQPRVWATEAYSYPPSFIKYTGRNVFLSEYENILRNVYE